MNNTSRTLLCLLIANLSQHANAQKNNETATLETVTVTARGFAEDNLETPFVVDIIDAKKTEDAHFVTAEDAFRSDPSGAIQNGGNIEYSSLWMRGSGSLSITSLEDSSVDFRVDGISNGKTGWGRNFIDIERIEIAKGPQGTLLGSDAEAGSVTIKTVDPEDEFDARLKLGVGNKHQKSIQTMVNVPLSDNLALRVAGMSESKDNDLIRKEDKKPLNTQKKQGIQVKFGWHDDDYQNEVVLGAYHDKNTNNVPFAQTDFSTNEVATFNLPHNSENLSKGVTLNIKSDLGFADFSSTSGYHKYDSEIERPLLPPEALPFQYQGLAALGLTPAFYPMLDNVLSLDKNNHSLVEHDYKQLSQEFRLASKPDSDVKWVAGLYLDKKERDFFNDGKTSLDELPPQAAPIKAYLTSLVSNADFTKNTNSSTQAIFGEITYPATDKLDVIAGARVTHKKQKQAVKWIGNSNNIRAQGGIKTDSKTLSDTAFTGRLGLSYAVTPNWRVYGLQSRGNKFGGFDDYDTNVAYDQSMLYYESSTIDSTEIGSKFQSEDQRVKLGFAVYQNSVKDDHVSIKGQYPEYKTQLANVNSRSRGLEIDASWQATEHLKIYGDIALTDTKVTRVPQSARGITAVGNQMLQVPKVSANIGVQYRDEVAFIPKGEWFAGIDYRYVGDRFADANNTMKLDSYGLLSAQIGISNDHHRLSLWGKNLTDKKYLYVGIPQEIANFGTLAPERSFGMDYTYQF